MRLKQSSSGGHPTPRQTLHQILAKISFWKRIAIFASGSRFNKLRKNAALCLVVCAKPHFVTKIFRIVHFAAADAQIVEALSALHILSEFRFEGVPIGLKMKSTIAFDSLPRPARFALGGL